MSDTKQSETPTPENWCVICGRYKQSDEGTSVCCCKGIQTFSLSKYPGEFRLSESHPANVSDEQWYPRKIVDEKLDTLERENQRLREALTKINRIRNSIVAHQSCNFSEHVYPLVAALNEAGIPGMPYPEALAYFGPVTERAAKAELKLDQWQKCAAELAKRLTFVAPRDGDNFAYLQDEQALSIFNKLNTNE